VSLLRLPLETIMEGKIPEGLVERRHLVNQLLDAVSHEKGLRVVKIINLYFDQEAQRMLSNLLKDVASRAFISPQDHGQPIGRGSVVGGTPQS
jgi:hypothetical protein